MNKIDLIKIIKDKKTYPNWSSNISYKLNSEIIDENNIWIYYDITNTVMRKRIKRVFPRYIQLTPGFCWILGFYKAEGVSSIKSTSYKRFSITNKNILHLKKFFYELDKSGLLIKNEINGKCFQIHHFLNNPEDVKKYWAEKLDFPIEMFSVIDYNHNLSKEGNGVCHFDIGNVLLRRIIDLLNEEIIK